MRVSSGPGPALGYIQEVTGADQARHTVSAKQHDQTVGICVGYLRGSAFSRSERPTTWRGGVAGSGSDSPEKAAPMSIAPRA